MKITDMILESLWVVLSFINFINGLGFIYMGLKMKNNNWILEGLVYEMPWILMIIFLLVYPSVVISLYLSVCAFILQVASIIRSLWVDYKYIQFIRSNELYLTD